MAEDPEEVSIVGKIHSVQAKDFITYDYVKFSPGENLNLILGPNGSGKSTLVAAIIIGMGGNCKLLSRSTDLVDYIKNEKDKFEVTIKLFENEKRSLLTLYRSYDHAKTQIFSINNKSVSHKDFLAAIRKFNIQIDNLCQFLPQDRVQDFAKMNAQEILLNTQKSVCGEDMMKRFEKLIEYQESLKDSTKTLNDDMKKLQEMESRRAQFKDVMEKIKERNALVQSLDVCKMKKAWVEFEKLYVECKEVEKDLNQSRKLLAAHENELLPYVEQDRKFEKMRLSIERALSAASDLATRTQNQLKTFNDRFEKLEDEMNRSRANLNGAIKAARDREKEIQRADVLLKMTIQDLKTARQELGDENHLKEMVDQNRQKCNDIRRRINEIYNLRNECNTELENDCQPQIVAIKRRIENFANAANQKLNMMERKFPDTFKGIQWLRQNRDSFRGRIYETALMEVNVIDPKYAKFLENCVSIRDLTSFICEDTQDATRLMNVFREQLGLRLTNVACNSRTEIYPPKVPLANIQKFGFDHYLIDTLTGPAPVLNQLSRLYNIHNIPIGNDRANDMADKIPSSISLFFTSTKRYRVSVSAYTGQSSISVDEIKSKGLMDITVNEAAIKEATNKLTALVRKTDKLKNERNQLESKAADIQATLEESRAHVDEIEQRLSIVPKFQDKIASQTIKLQSLKNQSIDVDNEKRKFREQIATTVKKMLSIEKDHIGCLNEYNTAIVDREQLRLKLSLFDQSKSDVSIKIREIKEKIQEAQRQFSIIKRTVEEKKELCRRKQTEAKELTGGKTPSNDSRFPYKKDFDKLPAELDELESHMDELQSRIDCMTISENFSVSDYEALVKSIETLQAKIANFTRNTTDLEQQMKDHHNQWLPALESVVEIINRNFSQFMASMNYAGEVQISRDSDHDYKSYGINIAVKYRNGEKMQTLGRFIQSGGERAVAIAVYTLSMQHISQVPFRCVDEINQGMDARNERKIFEMLVRLTCVAGRSQYFFITPKLLSNLPWNDLITVHTVHSGTGVKIDLSMTK